MSAGIGIASQTASSDNFEELWRTALQRYEKETGQDLLEHPFEKAIALKPSSAKVLIGYLEQQDASFKSFRSKGKKVLGVLESITNVILRFLDVGAELVPNTVPGGKAILVALGVLLKAVNGVSRLYNTIETLFNMVQGCLERVLVYLDASKPLSLALKKTLIKILAHILTLLAIVTKYCIPTHWAISDTKSTIKTVWRVIRRRIADYFRGILGNEDVQEALEKLELLTNEEQLAVAADTNATVRKTYDSTVINDLRSWLRPPERLPNNYEMKKKPGSCQWFFNDQFNHWMAHSNGVYWVYGVAVIDKLEKDHSLPLAYFYFDHTDRDKQDCRGLASSLVFQIGTRPESLPHLKARYASRLPGRTPTLDDLLDLLSGILPLCGKIFVIIDALDECPERARDSTLLDFLGRLCEIQKDDAIDLRLLVVSRPELDIRDRMLKLYTHALDIRDAHTHTDEIYNHISAELHNGKSTYYHGWSEDLTKRVHAALMKKSNGMFLWVVLQLRILRRCSPENAEGILRELPDTIEETYERILNDFPRQITLIDRARCVFECIAFAKRPLSLNAVVEIFSVRFDTPTETSIDANAMTEITDPEVFVLGKCPSLLDFVTAPDGDRIVQFIHLSAKEYLVSSLIESATYPAPLYHLDAAAANSTLARVCIASLNLHDILSSFQQYAADYWDAHLTAPIQVSLQDHRIHFSGVEHPDIFNTWARNRFGRDRMFAPDDFSELGEIVNLRGKHGKTALHVAAQWGCAQICRALLDHRSTLIGENDEYGNTPLHSAAYSGNVDALTPVVQAMQTEGIVVQAVQTDSPEVNRRSCNDKGQTALHIATRRGHVNATRMLLEYYLPVYCTDKGGNLPLHNAARSGQLSTVRLLLDLREVHNYSEHFICGAMVSDEVRARNHEGHTALHISSQRGHADIVQALLEHGALVDEKDNDDRTAADLAEGEGHSEVVRILHEYREEHSI
ncbi:unnamed protein product [Peniophora sp. CBMAI 1063]|nr:unnamed protein product [Peniophora sp. CBMAI 1063]